MVLLAPAVKVYGTVVASAWAAALLIIAQTDPLVTGLAILFGGGGFFAGLFKLISDHRAIETMQRTLNARAEAAEARAMDAEMRARDAERLAAARLEQFIEAQAELRALQRRLEQ